MQTAPTTQPPGVHRKKIGDIVVTAINDGMVQANYGLLKNIDEAEAKRFFASRFRALEPIFTLNCFLVNTSGKLVLIDAGGGPVQNDLVKGGALNAALGATGVSPGAVDTILMTHLHPDHAGGLIDKDGRAVFPNAEFLLHADEAKFWLDTENPPDEMKPYFEAARRAVAPYKDRLRTFSKGAVAPGIEAEPLPGHTPGHTGFHIRSGNESLLLFADIVHAPALQAAFPDVYVAFDADPEQAKTHRKRLLDKAAADKLLVAGPHLDFPAFAHVETAGTGYAFIPDVWRPFV